MNKYDPLSSYLKSNNFERIPMTFREIETLIHDKLPASARKHRAWWSNNPSNSVITKAWLDAGYITRNVDLTGEKLVFTKDQSSPLMPSAAGGTSGGTVSNAGDNGHKRKRPQIFGCMKGTLTIAPGYDITQPADPDWGKVYDDD